MAWSALDRSKGEGRTVGAWRVVDRSGVKGTGEMNSSLLSGSNCTRVTNGGDRRPDTRNPPTELATNAWYQFNTAPSISTPPGFEWHFCQRACIGDRWWALSMFSAYGLPPFLLTVVGSTHGPELDR